MATTRTAILLSAWCILNAFLSFAARLILRSEGGLGFPSPSSYTLCHQMASSVFGLLLCKDRARLWHKARLLWRQLLVIGACNAFAIYLNNASLAAISVVLNQVIKSCTPLPTMLLQCLILPSADKAVAAKRWAAMAIVAGAVFASVSCGGDATMTWGVLLALASTFLTALRNVCSAALLQGNEVPVVNLLVLDGMWSTLALSPFVHHDWPALAQYTQDNPRLSASVLVTTSCAAVAYNFLTLELIQRTTPLTLSVAATCRQCILLFVSSLAEPVPLTLGWALGVLQVAAGSAVYSLPNPRSAAGVAPSHEMIQMLPSATEENSLMPKRSMKMMSASAHLACWLRRFGLLAAIGICTLAGMSAVAFGAEMISSAVLSARIAPLMVLPAILCEEWGGRFEVVLARYSEPLEHMVNVMTLANTMRAPITVYQAIDGPSSVDVPKHVQSIIRAVRHAQLHATASCIRLEYTPNLLDEAFGFLHFMAHRYESLPAQVLFLKGSLDDVSNLSSRLLQQLLHRIAIDLRKQADNEAAGAADILVDTDTEVAAAHGLLGPRNPASEPCAFASMPTEFLPSREQVGHTPGIYEVHSGYLELWRKLENEGVRTPARWDDLKERINFNYFVRATFIASAKAIRRQPQAFYQIALDVMLTFSAYDFRYIVFKLDLTHHGSARRRAWGGFMLETLWHVILSDPDESRSTSSTHSECLCQQLGEETCAKYTELMMYQELCSYFHYEWLRPGHLRCQVPA